MSPVREPGEPGAALLAAFRQFLADDGWPLLPEEETERATAIAVEGESGHWVCVAQVSEGRELALFSSVLPVVVPPERRDEVGAFLHRANAGLLVGGFQYDLDEGGITYVTSFDLGEADVAALAATDALDPVFRQLVYMNLSTVEQYLPSLMRVVYGALDAPSAIAEAEQE